MFVKPFTRPSPVKVTMALVFSSLATQSFAYDVNEQLSVDGLLSAASQCQQLSSAPGYSDTCKSVGVFQPVINYHPGEKDELSLKLGFAEGKGLRPVSPFVIEPWAATLEDDVRNINGHNWSHLLNAWYKHNFSLTGKNRLSATIGVIDSTDYLDINAYANDEYTQFMNTALTNGPNVFLPSYDLGMALILDAGPWSFRAVTMHIAENNDGYSTNFYGLQAGYRITSKLGSGQYRAVIATTSNSFLDEERSQLTNRSTALISFDQEFGNVVGGWIRFGWRNDDVPSNHDAIYSGGIDIKGLAWKRHEDNIGLGYAYLQGANLAIENSDIVEAYYRWQLGNVLALTADIQYLEDDYKTGQDINGYIYSLRATAEF